MPNFTTNLNLEKPLTNENYNIEVFNANADKLDTAIKEVSSKVDNFETPVKSVNGKTGAVTLAATDIKTVDGKTLEEFKTTTSSQLDTIADKTGDLKQSLVPITGYLKCDGSIVNDADYPALSKFLIGTGPATQGGDLSKVSFISRQSNLSEDLNGVVKGSKAYGNDIYVVVGDNGVITTSTDGITWTKRTSPISADLSGIAYGAGIFVAVGTSGTVITSTDGIAWIKRTSGTVTILQSVAYGAGIFVAVGISGTVITSTDGITWTKRTSPISTDLNGIAYGDDTFVVVGDSGKIITSTDGISWTSRNSTLGNDYYYVAYGNGTFITASPGSSPTILLSTNKGVDWNKTTNQPPGGSSNIGLNYVNGTFIVNLNSSLNISKDLETWTVMPVAQLRKMIFKDNFCVAVGFTGAISTAVTPTLTPVLEHTYIKT